ncbi:CDP-glucose 4,6-dehydratase [Gammaproteobacteria bacterium]|nr:CDP-glucose 4,6-dehydratase [Gammaproteobacteria bacterium]
MIDTNFWKDKKVFLTGHTGFKGSWMAIWLSQLGSKVKGYALSPPTIVNLFNEAKIESLIESEINDIRDYDKLTRSINDFSPDIVIHMAAQPLVRASYKKPLETYETNVMGTANILEASIRSSTIKAVVNITTDKCYENREIDIAYKETDSMGGFDPYSSSKGCAELVTAAYKESFYKNKNIGIASVRAGNVIGGGDWAEDRLIPDVLKAFELNKAVIIRNPKATRPWQHVLEPLSGYLLLAERLYNSPLEYSEGWNFGPNYEDVKPVDDLIDYMIKIWPGNSWKIDNTDNPHEANLLKLDISKAKSKLQWAPVWSLETTLNKIVQWHMSWLKQRNNAQELCIKEINQYIEDSKDGKH